MSEDITQSLTKIGNALQRNEKRIVAKLGGMIKWEYFCSAFLTTIEKNPLLAECSEASLVKAVLDASQLRLIPDGVLGEAYIVPYGRTATLIVGYKGLIQLCLRSPLVKKIGARIVYENDHFKYEYGMNEACVHIPTEEEPGEIRGAYGVFEMSDGVKGFEFWPFKKLMNHKIKFAKGLDKKDKKGNWTSTWRTNEEAMIVKTVLRSITKLLPKSIEEVSQANSIEDGVDLDLADAIDIEVAKEKKAVTAKVLDDQKPDLETIKDAAKSPSDDLPIDDPPELNPPDQITTDQFTVFLDRAKELKIPTKKLVEFAKKNGFDDASQITTDKYDGMLDGLDHLTK